MLELLLAPLQPLDTARAGSSASTTLLYYCYKDWASLHVRLLVRLHGRTVGRRGSTAGRGAQAPGAPPADQVIHITLHLAKC